MFRRIRGLKAHHLMFSLALAALVALGAWWTVYFGRTVDLEKEANLNSLVHVAVVTALIMGYSETPPVPGPVEGAMAPLEVVRTSDRIEGDRFVPLVPHHPDLGVRPRKEAVDSILHRAERRRTMFLGEGALLFVLLCVCVVMLFQLVRSERRQLRDIESFLSTVTHEMKTPLTGIQSMLQTFAAGRVPPDQADTLYAMGLKETERLEHMVENILISGRLRARLYPVETATVQLRALVEGFVLHRRRYLADRPDAIRLAWEPPEDEVRALCDRDALAVVLDNLVDNALKYGGEPPDVTLRVRHSGGRVELAVEDRGIGFEPGQAERLFERFHRSQEGRREVHHGTGLGLSISRELVRRMGGTIAAESDGPGKGSRFIVSLAEAAT